MWPWPFGPSVRRTCKVRCGTRLAHHSLSPNAGHCNAARRPLWWSRLLHRHRRHRPHRWSRHQVRPLQTRPPRQRLGRQRRRPRLRMGRQPRRPVLRPRRRPLRFKACSARVATKRPISHPSPEAPPPDPPPVLPPPPLAPGSGCGAGRRANVRATAAPASSMPAPQVVVVQKHSSWSRVSGARQAGTGSSPPAKGRLVGKGCTVACRISRILPGVSVGSTDIIKPTLAATRGAAKLVPTV